MNAEIEVFRAIANSLIFKTVLSFTTLVIVGYIAKIGRAMYRKLDYTSQRVHAMHTATIEVLNGKGKEYEALVEMQMEAWRKQQAYAEAPTWKFRKLILVFKNIKPF